MLTTSESNGVIIIYRDGRIVGYDDKENFRLIVDGHIHNYQNENHRNLMLRTLYNPAEAAIPDTMDYHRQDRYKRAQAKRKTKTNL